MDCHFFAKSCLTLAVIPSQYTDPYIIERLFELGQAEKEEPDSE